VVTPGVHEFLTEAAREAADFDGDEADLAARARDGDRAAISGFTRAYAALAVLAGLRLRPTWLPAPDAGQEAMIVLKRLVECGSTTIAVELPANVQEMFEGLRKPPEVG
jgi:hypothetical protein